MSIRILCIYPMCNILYICQSIVCLSETSKTHEVRKSTADSLHGLDRPGQRSRSLLQNIRTLHIYLSCIAYPFSYCIFCPMCNILYTCPKNIQNAYRRKPSSTWSSRQASAFNPPGPSYINIHIVSVLCIFHICPMYNILYICPMYNKH